MPGPMRDSLSKCETNPYSIYDVRKKPANAEATCRPATKDTLELKGEDLKKEALNRLRHTAKYQIIHSSFMRVGKYVFVGLMLPPYLLLYRIPRWTLIVVIPSFFSACKILFQKTESKIKKQVRKIIHQMQLQLQKMKNQFEALIQPVVRLYLEFRKGLTLFRHYINSKLKKRFDQFKSIAGFPKKVKEKMAPLKQALLNRFSAISIKFSEVRKKVVKNISEKTKQITDFFPKIKTNILTNCQQFFISLSSDFKLQWENSRQLASGVAQWGKKVLKPYKNDLIIVKQKLSIFYAQQIAPFLKQVNRLCRELGGQIKNYFSRKNARLEQFFEQAKKKLTLLANRQFNFDKSALSWLPHFIRKPLERYILRPYVIKAITIAWKCLMKVLSGMLQAIILLWNSLLKLIQLTVTGIQFVLKYGKIIFEKGLNFLLDGLAQVGKFTRLVIYHFLVTVIMIGILIVWGFRLVGHVLDKRKMS